ncbi:hypothetical protein [Halomonas casei]|uniref:hypothetical protein n=1 Tax=Halomonas casei TaxID=2742613 RepID=UPI003CE791DA
MSRDKTKRAIELAIIRINKGRPKVVAPTRKLSIASVAEEAGISNATIHNRYPALADQIRQINNKTSREKLAGKETALKDADLLLKELREAVAEREADLKKLAVANLRLSTENKSIQQQNLLLKQENEGLVLKNRKLLAEVNRRGGDATRIR